MAQIGGTIGSGRRDDFASVREAAEEVGINPTTLKRWLKEKKVPGVVWGKDARGWLLVEKKSISKLKEHKNEVHIV
jgi:DNA-binding transcriptional regulator YhcF (GntR family)